MRINAGLAKSESHFSAGNAALLVVVNGAGAYWDRFIVEETILAALEHFGMPYRLLDLASERPTKNSLANCAAIILAQNRLGESLTDAETQLIAEAVKNGIGLVNFDNDLRSYKAAFLEMFGFERIKPYPYATNIMRIRENEHYITRLQSSGKCHAFDRMVTATMIEKYRRNVVVLAEAVLGKEQLVYIRHLVPDSAFEPRNYPVVFAARWGKGKAVQFALNPRLWRKAFFGHARGIDDLFSRSILWTARKPFAANMIPPFVAMSIDDCRGAHDFGYVDIACKHKYIPMPSLFIDCIPERLFPKIKQGLKTGKVLYNTHGFDYYHLLVYDYGKGEYGREELKKNFALDDLWWKKVGTKPAITNRFHWGEYGVKALPFLKERGRLFINPALQMGLMKADQCMDDGYRPYNLQNCYYDYLPDDRDFFAFNSMSQRGQEDVLTGCTANLLESGGGNDVEKAANYAAQRIALGLGDGFYADVVTHEQKISVLSLKEWEQILSRAEQLTKHYEKIYAGHDEIAQYLKAKTEARIGGAVVKGNKLCCKLEGRANTPLRLSVFRDEDDSVAREYKTVRPFDGQTCIE